MARLSRECTAFCALLSMFITSRACARGKTIRSVAVSIKSAIY